MIRRAAAELPLDHLYQGRILDFAHRGARLQAPENTLPAFRRAAELGADGVELDVHLSRDGVPAVIHDFRVDATTNGTGLVRAKSLAELKELDAGSHFSPEFRGVSIPTLAEVFEDCGSQLYFNVELKTIGSGWRLAEAVVAVIQHYNVIRRVIVSSFSPVVLGQVRRLNAAIPLGFLFAPGILSGKLIGSVARSIIGPHQAQHPHFQLVSHRFVDWAHESGYRINTWTVNTPDDIVAMAALAVDMIMSDAPDRVRDVLASRH